MFGAGAVQVLSEAGHDVDWSGGWSQDPGDDEILATANREERVLITLDKDFGELAILQGSPHCGIIRLEDISARQQAARCIDVLTSHGRILQRGAIITVEPGRLRIRPQQNDAG